MWFVIFCSGVFFKVFFFWQNTRTVDDWSLRKLSRIMTERAKSQSIASSMFIFLNSLLISFTHPFFFKKKKILKPSKPEYHSIQPQPSSSFFFLVSFIQRQKQILTVITRNLDTTRFRRIRKEKERSRRNHNHNRRRKVSRWFRHHYHDHHYYDQSRNRCG